MTNEDLRWLYRQDPQTEETKVLSTPEQYGASGDYPQPGSAQPAWGPGVGQATPQGAGYPPSGAHPAPSGYPPSGAHPTGVGYPVPSGYPAAAGAGQPGHPPPVYPSAQPTRPAAAEPPSSRPTRRRRRRRFRPVRTLLLLFLAWIIYLVGAPIYAYLTVSTLPEAASTLPDQPGTTVLLVGSDARDDLTDEEQRRLGTGSTEGRRTDSMLLLHTSTSGKSVLLSLPRDSYIDIPGKGKNKLNAAYAFGGPSLLIQTVEANTGIKVDGYVEIGMAGLADLVDAVGGIEVCPERAWQDQDSHLDIPAGCQRLDGVTALAYARMRKEDPRGDLGRMERQREVLGQIVKESLHPMTFINPVRYWRVNAAVASTLRRTENTGMSALFSAGTGLVSGWSGSGIELTVPVSDPNAKTKAGSSMIWDAKAAPQVFEAITKSDLDQLERFR